jgi:putative transposase
MSARTSYTATELAALGLQGLPSTRQAIEMRAAREGWAFIQSSGRGGKGGVRREFVVASLPAAIREQLMKTAATTPVPPPVSGTTAPLFPMTAAPAKVSALKGWQRDIAEARAAILQEMERLAALAGITQACRTICDLAQAPEGDWPLAGLVARANARLGESGERTLATRTLMRWRAAHQAQGFIGLAPGGKGEDLKAKVWHAPLLAMYQRPQKPFLQTALADLARTAPKGMTLPSYHQARRFLDKMSLIERNKGRMGEREIRAIKPFVRRDTSKNLPGDFYVFDGHTFDAEIAHPSHGRPFRPEITWGVDGATRLCVGFSVGLAESSLVVIDAVRYAAEKWAVPAILYTDRGSGYKNHRLGDPDMGILARIGITQTLGRARNPQAHGIVEKAHQTLWVAGAKEFDTFLNAKMDTDAKGQVFKITRRDVKATGASRHLMPFNLFVQWAERRVDWYNNRPHRALPRVVDADGTRRHMTPLEAWKRGAEVGADLHRLEGAEADDMFRPYEYRTARRGEIALYGNLYFHADLAHYDPKVKLRVGYDIHDASRVWVRDPNGRLICIAQLDGNKRDYFPVSMVERAAENRAKSREARLQTKLQEVRDELNPPTPAIEYQAAEVLDLPIHRMPLAPADPVLIEEVVPQAISEARRPMFEADYTKYEWLQANADQMTGADDEWLAAYRTTDEWASLYGDDDGQEKAAAGSSEGTDSGS